MRPVYYILFPTLIVGFLIPGCEDDKNPSGPVDLLPARRYEGHVTINMRQGFNPYFPIERTDSVTLSATGSDYALTFQTHNSNICGSLGTISRNYETDFIILKISQSVDGSCDSLRSPRGSFKADIKDRDLNMEGEYTIRIPNSQRDDTIKYVFDLSAP